MRLGPLLATIGTIGTAVATLPATLFFVRDYGATGWLTMLIGQLPAAAGIAVALAWSTSRVARIALPVGLLNMVGLAILSVAGGFLAATSPVGYPRAWLDVAFLAILFAGSILWAILPTHRVSVGLLWIGAGVLLVAAFPYAVIAISRADFAALPGTLGWICALAALFTLRTPRSASPDSQILRDPSA